MELRPNNGISGIWVKFKNPETGESENRCFEDLPEEEQDVWMNSLDIEATRRLAKMLTETLNTVVDHYNAPRE